MFDLMKKSGPEGDPNLAYWAELEGLSAERWSHARYGQRELGGAPCHGPCFTHGPRQAAPQVTLTVSETAVGDRR
jgi:hypothetical protein